MGRFYNQSFEEEPILDEEEDRQAQPSLVDRALTVGWDVATAPVRGALWGFEQLNRPQSAAQNAMYALLGGRPEQLGSAAWEGAKLGGVRDWGPSLDIVDPWKPIIESATQIAEGATGEEAKFNVPLGGKMTPYQMYKAPRDIIANVGLDPLLFFGPLSKIPSVAQYGARAADVLASTRPMRALGMKPSMANFGEFNVMASNVLPKARWAQKETERIGELERTQAIEALKNMRRGFGPPEPPKEYAGIRVGDWIFAKDRLNYGQVEDIGKDTARVHFVNRAEGTEATVDLPLDWLKSQRKVDLGKAREEFKFPINYIEAFERPQKMGLQRRYEEALQPLQRFKVRNDELFASNNQLREAVGLAPRTDVESETYQIMNRILDPRKSVREGIRGGELAGYAKEARKGLHREIFKWEDLQGREVYRGFKDHPDFLNSGRKIDQVGQDPVTGENLYRFFGPEAPNGISVRPRQLSLKEAQKVAPGRKWVDDPFDALALAQQRMQREGAFLQFLKQGKDENWLRDAAGNTDPLFEQLKTPGLEHLAARKEVVGRIDQLNRLMLNPERVLKAFDEAGNQIHKGFFQALGRVVQGWKDYRNIWAQGMLLRLGFHVNNAGSNVGLAYVGGKIPEWSLGQRFAQGLGPSITNFLELLGKSGAAKAVGKRSPLKEYKNPLTNEQLLREVEKRGGTISWSRSEMGGEGLQARYSVPVSERYLSGKGPMSFLAQKGLKGFEWLSNKNLELVGQTVENQAKFAVVIDWIKQHVPKGETITARHLDRAVFHAKDAIFDYGDLPTIIQALRQFNPYVSWHYNILRRTLKDLVQRPQRLARQGRIYGAMWDQLTEQDTPDTRAWMQNQGPIKGLRGWEFPRTKEGLRNILLTGRMIPQQEINDWLTRPYETAIGQLHPIPKSIPEIIHNRSTFFNAPIDRAVEELPEDERGFAFGQALVNPIKEKLFGIPAPYSSRNRVFGFNMPDAWQYLWDTFSPFSALMKQVQSATETLGAALPNIPGINQLANPGRPAMSPGEFGLNFLTGGKFYPLDEEQNRAIREKQYENTLRNLQTLYNIASEKGREDEAERYQRLIDSYELKRDREENTPKGVFSYRPNAQAVVEPAN